MDTEFMVGDDDEGPSPGFYRLPLKHILNSTGQGLAAWSAKPYQKQPCMRTGHVTADIRKVQILGDEEASGVLSGNPNVRVWFSCQAFLRNGVRIMSQLGERPG